MSIGHEAQHYITQSIFYRNTASDTGGALFIDKDSVARVTSSRFEQNTAVQRAGAIMGRLVTLLQLVSSNITGCRSIVAGGVYLIDDQSSNSGASLFIDSSRFRDNTARSHAAALMLVGSSKGLPIQIRSHVLNSVFDSNVAGETGSQLVGTT